MSEKHYWQQEKVNYVAPGISDEFVYRCANCGERMGLHTSPVCPGKQQEKDMSEETMPHHCDTEFMKPSEETLSGTALFYKMYKVSALRPSSWWTEFMCRPRFRGEWLRLQTESNFYTTMNEGWPICYSPTKVKLSGEVEPEVIRDAKVIAKYGSYAAAQVAQALLDCVKEE